MEFRFVQVLFLAGQLKMLARRHHDLLSVSKSELTTPRQLPHRRAAAIIAVVLLDDADRMLREIYASLGFRAEGFDQFVFAEWNEYIPSEDDILGDEHKVSARLLAQRLADVIVDVTIEEAQHALWLAASQRVEAVRLLLTAAEEQLTESSPTAQT